MRLCAALFCLCLVAPMARADEPPLRAGIVISPPFAVAGPADGLAGFVPALFRAIAARMQRNISFTAMPEAALEPALLKGEVDILPGPINATPERATHLLFTEGYLWSEFQFGAGTAHSVTRLSDLRGRRLAVPAHSLYAAWAEQNAARYGFTVLPVDSAEAAAREVLAGRAEASLAGSPVQGFAASHMPGFSAGLALPETRTHESAALRRGDVELRDEVEDALRCLKLNGTVARLSQQWLGREPDAEDLENLVVPGHGVPGLTGYDPKPHKAGC